MSLSSGPLLNVKNIFVSLYLACAMGMIAVIFANVDGSDSEGQTTISFALAWVFLYSITIYYSICINWRKKYVLALMSIPFLYLASTMWTLVPQKTLIYSILVLLNAIFSAFLVKKYDPLNLYKIYINTVLLLIAIGLILYLFGYQNVVYYDPHDRETILGTEPLRGLFNHKITAGYYAGLAFYLSSIAYTGLKRFFYSVTFLSFILLTGSSSALALLVLGACMMAILKFLRRIRASKSTIILVLLIVPAVLGAIGLVMYEVVLVALGRDPTLTGRTLLWAWGIEVALEKPLLGWGYLGYNGTELAAQAAMQFEQFENYAVPHFHSSYVQLLVETGFVAGFLIIGAYYLCVIEFVRRYVKSGLQDDAMVSFSLMWICVAGFFIHVMGRYNDLSMILFLYALGLCISARNRRGEH